MSQSRTETFWDYLGKKAERWFKTSLFLTAFIPLGTLIAIPLLTQ